MAATTSTVDTTVPGVWTQMNYHRRPEKAGTWTGHGAAPLDRNADADDDRLFVTDVRGSEDKFTVDNNGFQFIKHTTSLIDFQDMNTVREQYYPEIEALCVKQLGATSAHAWSHSLRTSAQAGTMKGPLVRPHIDRTARCIREHFPEMYDEKTCEHLAKSKCLHISVWRPLKTVHRDPIGVIESNSYDPSDVAAFQRPPGLAGAGRLESYIGFSSKTKSHKWMYMSEQKPDEVLFIKFTDEREGQQQVGCPHSAFNIEGTPEKTAGRESVEVRVIVAFDE